MLVGFEGVVDDERRTATHTGLGVDCVLDDVAAVGSGDDSGQLASGETLATRGAWITADFEGGRLLLDVAAVVALEELGAILHVLERLNRLFQLVRGALAVGLPSVEVPFIIRSSMRKCLLVSFTVPRVFTIVRVGKDRD